MGGQAQEIALDGEIVAPDDRGAHIDDEDNRGRTALMIAAELNHQAAADLLLARGADKSLRDKQGKSAADLTSLTALREKLTATQ